MNLPKSFQDIKFKLFNEQDGDTRKPDFTKRYFSDGTKKISH